MGSTKSQFADLTDGFAEVGTKTTWKTGLVIDVYKRGKFVVTSVRNINTGPPPGTLCIEEHIDGPVYVYTYRGVINTTDTPNTVYEIMIKPITDVKIGGRLKQRPVIKNDRDDMVDDSQLIFDDNLPNFTKRTPKKTHVDGRPPTTIMSNVDDYPDDNIANVE